MDEALAFFKELGFTPGAYGIWTGVLMFAAWLAREWRETRKLSADDRAARREGYAKQIESLQDENRNLRDDQRKLRQEYDQYRRMCQEETDSLRKMLIDMQGELAGAKRRIDTMALVIARRHEVEDEA